MNIAEYFLKEGKLEEVEKIFDGKFNLKQLYPERDVFHVSEATAFMSLCGRYFLRKCDIKKANSYLDMLYEFQDESKSAPHRRAPGHVRVHNLRRLLHDHCLHVRGGCVLLSLHGWIPLRPIWETSEQGQNNPAPQHR